MYLAPSRPSKHPTRNNARPPPSPTQRSADVTPSTSALGSSMLHPPAWKTGSAPNSKATGINLVEKIQPLSFVLPEEQTDNWDDDFEEGISFTKLQG